MMLAMTGVEEEMVAVVVVSFTKATTASFFLVSPSFSWRNVMTHETTREGGQILPWLQLPRPLEKPAPLFLSGLVLCGTFFMGVYMT